MVKDQNIEEKCKLIYFLVNISFESSERLKICFGQIVSHHIGNILILDFSLSVQKCSTDLFFKAPGTVGTRVL